MISLITVISVIGVAAGVMALVIALAINNGFRNTLQRNLLGATAHVTILEKEPGYGIAELAGADARKLSTHAARDRGCADAVWQRDPERARCSPTGAILKGIPLKTELPAGDILAQLKAGSLAIARRRARIAGQ